MNQRMRITLCLFWICTWIMADPVPKPDVEKAFPNLQFSRPVFITHAGDGSNRLFIVEKRGTIQVIENKKDVGEKKTFLNIQNRVVSHESELGLLGLAFHPDYQNNRYFYVNYTTGNESRRLTRISRFRASGSNPDAANEDSEVVFMEIRQPYDNHNGGMLAFGPDGYLYIGTGDGGSGGDPHNYAQNLTRTLGKILRIDVDNPVPNSGRPYGIPEDNPFVGNEADYDEEIWAYGMRNPWRFSFDSKTGLLYCADVGQGEYEEIDIIERGRNYGWRIMEGNHWYHYSHPDDTVGMNLVYPIKEYSHASGNSVTGGYVYYGRHQPDLQGAYIYGDFGSGRIWMLRYENGRVTQDETLKSTGINISSFGVDENQELYYCDYANGGIWQFENVNHAPEADSLIAPENGLLLAAGTDTLHFQWRAFSDADGDTLTYQVHLMHAGGDTSISAGTDTLLSFSAGSLEYQTEYQWFVSGIDKYFNIAYSDTFAFTTPEQLNTPPLPVQLLLPANGDTLPAEQETILFVWSKAVDAEEDTLHYRLHLTGEKYDSTLYSGRDTTTAWFHSNVSARAITLSWTVTTGDGEFEAVSDTFLFVIVPPAGLPAQPSNVPDTFQLFQNFPNPFNATTLIQYAIPAQGHVNLHIYNVQGHLVKKLVSGEKPAGHWCEPWNGLNEQGLPVSSGVYCVQLFHDGRKLSRSILLMK